jgi:hypothetical protein
MAKGGFPFAKKSAGAAKSKPNPFAGGKGKAPPFGKNQQAAESGPPVAMPFKKGGKVR